MTWFLWQKCSWQAHASMALLVIRLHEGAGIPSLEQFSSLPGLGGLPCLTLSKMFWRTLPHQRFPAFFQTLLLFIHICLKPALKQKPCQLSVSEELGCPGRWQCYCTHCTAGISVRARLLGNRILSSDTARIRVLKSFGEPSPWMKSPCWLFWRPGDFPASTQT